MNYAGYGIAFKNILWDRHVYEKLLDLLKRKKSPLLKTFASYCHKIDFINESDAFYDFCNDYQSHNTNERDNFKGVIVDAINLQEFHGTPVFRYEDFSIFVRPYFIEDTEDPVMYPTISKINEIFKEYIDPLLVSPSCPRYLYYKLG